jgi:hypothetical protein
MPGKRIQFDDETLHALNLLAHDRMQDFQELADEAFLDLLKKHGRPTDLKNALRQSIEADTERRIHPRADAEQIGDLRSIRKNSRRSRNRKA